MPIYESRQQIEPSLTIEIPLHGESLPLVAESNPLQDRLLQDEQANSCYLYVPSDPVERSALGGRGEETITFSQIRKSLIQSPREALGGTLLCRGPARLSLDPRSEDVEIFQSIATGAKVINGTSKSRLFGRSAYRKPYAKSGSPAGWIKYKGLTPYNEGSSPVHLTVPFEAEKGVLYDQFMEELRSGVKRPKSVLDHVTNRTGWELIGGNFLSSAQTEMLNSTRYAAIYKLLYDSYPGIELPVGLDRVSSFAFNGRLVSASDVLASRAEAFGDEADMLKLQFLYKLALKHRIDPNNRHDMNAFIQVHASDLDSHTYQDIAKHYLQLDPLVEMKYHSPSYFRNHMVKMMFSPDSFREELETFRSIYDHKDRDETLQTMYLGAIRDILCMYYPTDASFEFPRAGTFQELVALTHKVYSDTFHFIADNEMEILGRFVGIMNFLGMIPNPALEDKDMTLGRINDTDWGYYGQEDMIIPDESTSGFNGENINEENIRRQFGLITENLNMITLMLGTNAQYMDSKFRAARLNSLQRMRLKQDQLNINSKYLAELPDHRIKLLTLEKGLRA